MSARTLSYGDMIGQLPPDSYLVVRGVSWEEYQSLLETVGKNKGLRLSYDVGRLEIIVLSTEHENYAELIKQIVGALSLRLQVLHFGSATMRKKGESKGAEPDACFYVQNAESLGNGNKSISVPIHPRTSWSKWTCITNPSPNSRSMLTSVSRKSGVTTASRSRSIICENVSMSLGKQVSRHLTRSLGARPSYRAFSR